MRPPPRTVDQVPRTSRDTLSWIDACDGCWPAPRMNGLFQIHCETRTDRRLFAESWSSTRPSTLCCATLNELVKVCPGSCDGLVTIVPGSRSYSYDAK